MIECRNCETSQFLQIVRSRMYYPDDDDLGDEPEPYEISERYECTMCGASGGYTLDMFGEEELTGDVTHKPTLPLTMEIR